MVQADQSVTNQSFAGTLRSVTGMSRLHGAFVGLQLPTQSEFDQLAFGTYMICLPCYVTRMQ